MSLSEGSNELTPVERKDYLLVDNYLETELKLLFRNMHVDWKPYWEAAKFYADAFASREKGENGFKTLSERYHIPESPMIESIGKIRKEVKDMLDRLGNNQQGGEFPQPDAK